MNFDTILLLLVANFDFFFGLAGGELAPWVACRCLDFDFDLLEEAEACDDSVFAFDFEFDFAGSVLWRMARKRAFVRPGACWRVDPDERSRAAT